MKYVNAGLGLLFFGLGALGAFLPVLPTTPIPLPCWRNSALAARPMQMPEGAEED